MDPRELEEALARFIGTDDYYRHASELFSYTDGVKFLADEVGAYWLLDFIASHQKRARKDRFLRDFQIWELRVQIDLHRGVIVCLRDSDDEAFRQSLSVTDFPLPRLTLYLEAEILMLPGER